MLHFSGLLEDTTVRCEMTVQIFGNILLLSQYKKYGFILRLLSLLTPQYLLLPLTLLLL